jgi:tRNA (guanosine-2'-O-)-methyltransferase
MREERKNRIESVLLKRQGNLTVVMENVHDPHNISAVMRTCDAVGIQEIYVLNTVIPRHDYFGVKSSSSAAKWLTVHHFSNTELCFSALRNKFDLIYTTHLGVDSVELYDIDFTQSIALVFGNEHDGVSEEAQKLSDGNFMIPQMGMIKSLNISVACAVTIYEALRQKKNAGHYDTANVSYPEANTLRSLWGLTE